MFYSFPLANDYGMSYCTYALKASRVKFATLVTFAEICFWYLFNIIILKQGKVFLLMDSRLCDLREFL